MVVSRENAATFVLQNIIVNAVSLYGAVPCRKPGCRENISYQGSLSFVLNFLGLLISHVAQKYL